MKTRNGFVSNSSSCSFVVHDINYQTVEDVETQLIKILEFLDINKEKFSDFFGNVSIVHEYECTDDRRGNDYEDYDKLDMNSIGCVRIDSRCDNSIPFDVMEMIRIKLKAQHHHFG